MMKAERINKGRKYQQVIAGAKAIFLSEGFEAANMDVIAQTAKVSKATLYSYFPDKQSLFIQVAKSECENQADNALKIIDQTQSVDKVLYQAAAYTINCLVSDIAQQIFRICVSEIERFPILGKSFYENGPMMGQAKLVEYFIYNPTFLLIINEKVEWFYLAEIITYFVAFTLAGLHIYNLNYCQCKSEECCNKDS